MMHIQYNLCFIRKRSPLHAGLYTDDGNEEVVDQELTSEELYQLLQRHNRGIASGDTIRLPSDILYRRKSRYEILDPYSITLPYSPNYSPVPI